MSILQRYLTRQLIGMTLLSLFVLVALFSFFTLIDQLEDAGRGRYGVTEAVFYTLLTTPRIAYEVFPIAAVVAAMTVLGFMARYHELDILQAAGVSRYTLAAVLLRAAVPLLVGALLIGEVLAPAGEEHANNLRALALSDNSTLKSRYGFWIRDGDSYVNIRRMLPGNRIEDIYFYEFDERHNLISSFHAASAVHTPDGWQMEDISESVLTPDRVESRTHRKALWDSLIDPGIINVVTVRPQYLTMPGLARHISYLRDNAQESLVYEQALWTKLVKPFTIAAMILLAIPLVQGRGREIAVGQRVLTGAFAGVLFHLVSEVSTNLGVVFSLPPFISVAAPTCILVGLILWLMRREL